MSHHGMVQYNQHMGYIDISDHMANSYLMSQHTFKWITKLFFDLLDLTVFNRYVLLSTINILLLYN
jgi:hypothetical protein